MKIRSNQTQISDLYTQEIEEWETLLKRPEPASAEAIIKAQFIDKTYVWSGKR